MNFSEEFANLEKIVDRLEKEKLSIEESMELYEKGMLMTRELQKFLNEAEQKITKLSEGKETELTSSEYEELQE